MGIVNELDMVRQPVNSNPVDREIILEGVDDLEDLWVIRVDLLVAEVALLHRRQARRLCRVGGPVAELTIDLGVLDVEIMREFDGLSRCYTNGLEGEAPPSLQDAYPDDGDYNCEQ